MSHKLLIHILIMKCYHDLNLTISLKKGQKVIHALNLTHDSSIHYIEVVDLENIVLSEDNIFFIETNNRLAEFHARVLCAFESAAIHNPLKKV